MIEIHIVLSNGFTLHSCPRQKLTLPLCYFLVGEGSWTDASGDFIETGATCITHEGEDDTPTADLTYLPFSTEPLV